MCVGTLLNERTDRLQIHLNRDTETAWWGQVNVSAVDFGSCIAGTLDYQLQNIFTLQENQINVSFKILYQNNSNPIKDCHFLHRKLQKSFFFLLIASPPCTMNFHFHLNKDRKRNMAT